MQKLFKCKHFMNFYLQKNLEFIDTKKILQHSKTNNNIDLLNKFRYCN